MQASEKLTGFEDITIKSVSAQVLDASHQIVAGKWTRWRATVQATVSKTVPFHGERIRLAEHVWTETSDWRPFMVASAVGRVA